MKKSIFIYVAVLATISLAAYGFKTKNNPVTDVEETSCRESNIPDYFIEFPHKTEPKPDFFYDVDSRFITTITKEKLHEAKSILDLVPKEATEGIESIKKIKVVILPESIESTEISTSGTLNSTQLKLLQSLDYSSNFYIRADFKSKSPYTGKMVGEHLIYYITVIPQNEAEYKGGHLALLNYLEQNSIEETANVTKDQLKPGKVRFIRANALKNSTTMAMNR